MRAFIQCDRIDGLQAHTYAKFLLTRWAELTDTFDEFWYL